MMAFSSPQSIEELRKKLDPVVDAAVDMSSDVGSKVHGVGFAVTNAADTVYLKTAGYRDAEAQIPFDKDTVIHIWSFTKAIVATGLLQLVDEGRVKIDDPAGKYFPLVGEMKVIKGWNDDDTPKFATPDPKVTVKDLMMHTSGLSYDVFSEDYQRVQKQTGYLSTLDVTAETFKSYFLIHEPGSKWSYGTSSDFLGFLIEAVTGQKLGDYLEERIFGPAGMSCSFHAPSDKSLTAKLYERQGDSSLKPSSSSIKNEDDYHLGGQGLYGTLEDYLKFLRIWLNEGRTTDGHQIIKKESWEFGTKNNLPEGLCVDMQLLQHSDVPLGTDPNSKPDQWTSVFGITATPSPTGCPAGTLFWSGLANLYYWIDLENGIAGFYATQLFPLGDPSRKNFTIAQTKTYEALQD